MLGCNGQPILIMGGILSGWIRTISIMSPDWLMVPLARGVMGCLGKAELS